MCLLSLLNLLSTAREVLNEYKYIEQWLNRQYLGRAAVTNMVYSSLGHGQVIASRLFVRIWLLIHVIELVVG